MTKTAVSADVQSKEPRNLFAPGDVVRHRKGGTYYVLGRCTIEATLADCYCYRGEDGRVWVRPALEMEDGRFSLVYAGPSSPQGTERESTPRTDALEERLRCSPEPYITLGDLEAMTALARQLERELACAQSATPAGTDERRSAPSMDDLAECWSSLDWQERAERAVDKGRAIEAFYKQSATPAGTERESLPGPESPLAMFREWADDYCNGKELQRVLMEQLLERFIVLADEKLTSTQSAIGQSESPTEAMMDSVRGVLQILRNKPGCTFEDVRRHCILRGDDVMHRWPEWLRTEQGYVTERAAAVMIYEIMRAADRTGGSNG